MNLSQIFSQEQKKEEMQLEFPLQRLGKDRIKKASPLFLCLENVGKGKAEVKGKCELEFELACDRCLVPVPTKLLLQFERLVYAPGIKIPEEEDEQGFMDEYELNLELLLEEELQLCWPTKILCKEDCKGICPSCGQNLNEGSCGCGTFVPDIRFANLMDIFNGKE